ncbi:MAG TPA: hypothetical protein VH476_07310 [Solirubrobacterales bacterium]|jgi:hypothetical protein
MEFRHPDLIDRPRCRSDYSEGAELGLRRSAEGLIATLFGLVVLSIGALGSLAAEGTSFTPLLAILGALVVLLLLNGLRSG